MTIERRIAGWFRMDDARWERHANPWSGWTRLPALSLLALAAWSRVWIGGWAVLPVVAVVAWIWFNPGAFRPPRDKNAWITRAVLGERLWLARDVRPVPPLHRRVPNLLSFLVALGALLALWGVLVLDPAPLFAGLVMNLLAKLWFLDRMVWLHRDMGG